jgi:hypothetical protein
MDGFDVVLVSDTPFVQIANDDGLSHSTIQDVTLFPDSSIDPRISKVSVPTGSASSSGLLARSEDPASTLDKTDYDTLSSNHFLPAVPHTKSSTHRDDKYPTVPQPTMPKAPTIGKPRAQFMLHMPHNEYLFTKGGSINATMVDIIALLPQWFRNRDILLRLLNNGITSNIHLAILEEHRHLNISTSEDTERARDHLSDAYRKVMRRTESGWIKRNHKVPKDWDVAVLSIENFVPEAAEKAGYAVSPPIPFKSLAIGLKKLPQGPDAGDITRALDYTMQNHKVDEYGRSCEFMFPDDIHLVLNHIGRTQITADHLDTFVIARYGDVLREAEQARRKRIAEDLFMQERCMGKFVQQSMDWTHSHQLPPLPSTLRQHEPFQPQYETMPTQAHVLQQMQPAITFSIMPNKHAELPYNGMGILMPMPTYQPHMPQHTPPDTSHGGRESKHCSFIGPPTHHLLRSSSQQAAAAVASELISRGSEQPAVDFPDIPDICKYQGDWNEEQYNYDDVLQFSKHWTAEQQMDGLMAANRTLDLGGLSTPLSSPSLSSPLSAQLGGLTQQSVGDVVTPPILLHDSVEGLSEIDQTGLARA